MLKELTVQFINQIKYNDKIAQSKQTRHNIRTFLLFQQDFPHFFSKSKYLFLFKHARRESNPQPLDPKFYASRSNRH